MIFDRRCHGRVLALQRRVFAAHDALQLGEFANGFGAQIGLGQHNGAIDQGGIGTGNLGEISGQRPDAGNTLALAAELGMEGNVQRVELGHTLIERLLQIEAELSSRGFQRFEIGQIALVALPEMQRVGQAGAHDLAVAVNNFLAAIRRLDIGDENEAVGQRLAGLRARDETLLIGLDGQADDLGRDREVILLERAH